MFAEGYGCVVVKCDSHGGGGGLWVHPHAEQIKTRTKKQLRSIIRPKGKVLLINTVGFSFPFLQQLLVRRDIEITRTRPMMDSSTKRCSIKKVKYDIR